MENWQQLLRQSTESIDDLINKFNLEPDIAKKLNELFQVRINPYYLSLIQEPNDPIWKQCIPSPEELEDDSIIEDPLNEDAMSPVPNIVHRYPDRVLFLVSSQCSMYCRFCTRKRKVGNQEKISMKHLESAFQYLENHPEINDVILSGGDPLMLTDTNLENILKRLRSISHIQVIRLGTKMPCTLPQRVTSELCDMLKKYHPIFVNTHFNHPREITPESKEACERLVNAGCPVGCQTVLLKGVNDNVETMRELMKKLISIRVKPYYLFQADLTKSTKYFRTTVAKGKEIMKGLRGHISGLAIPQYVIDSPGGGGKIPILPDYVLEHNAEKIVMRNYQNNIYEYPEN